MVWHSWHMFVSTKKRWPHFIFRLIKTNSSFCSQLVYRSKRIYCCSHAPEEARLSGFPLAVKSEAKLIQGDATIDCSPLLVPKYTFQVQEFKYGDTIAYYSVYSRWFYLLKLLLYQNWSIFSIYCTRACYLNVSIGKLEIKIRFFTWFCLRGLYRTCTNTVERIYIMYRRIWNSQFYVFTLNKHLDDTSINSCIRLVWRTDSPLQRVASENF